MKQEASPADACGTCYGQGAIATEHGPLECADCAGQGRLPSGLVRTEWRLRQLEGVYAATGGEHAQDFNWLIGEVRRAHHALLQILAASQDTDADDATSARIRFLANDVLGVYPARKAD